MAIGQVYSERFILVSALNGTQLYTVPAGKRAIVTCVDFLPVDATVTFFQLGVGGKVVAGKSRSGTDLSSWQWQGRHVCYGGETIRATSVGGPSNVAVSGYLFADPPP